MEAFVGIDLGTTFSVVAWINPAGQPEVIADDAGNVLAPSVIYFGPDGPVVGTEAKELQAAGERDVASFFKRLMGDRNYQAEYGGTSYSPVGLSSLVLKHLVAVAQNRHRIGGEKSELKRMQKTVFPKLEFIAVSDFDDIIEFARLQIAHHSRSRNFRHEISYVAVK